MKPIRVLILTLAAAAVWAQTAPSKPAASAEPDPSTVLATFDDGKQLTYGEMQLLLASMPPQNQKAAMQDRKAFVKQFALLRKLTQMAVENKLDQQSPTKEAIELHRMQLLAGAQVNYAMDHLIKVAPEDVEKKYQATKDRYQQVQVKAIYISFASSAAPAGGKKLLTEAEARIKAERLLKEIRGGADFVKLVKAHSEDQSSAAKDGDFGNIRRGDKLPDAVRDAIFALKQGEVSEPVRQPNGYYLFRAEKLAVQPFEQVRDELFNEVKQERFRQWMDATQASLKVTIAEEKPAAAAPATK